MSIDEFVTITRKEFEGLKSLVLQLKEELRLLKNGKKSHSSHTSPSHDGGRSNSLREKIEKKAGGQQGHSGSTLERTDTPNEIIIYNL